MLKGFLSNPTICVMCYSCEDDNELDAELEANSSLIMLLYDKSEVNFIGREFNRVRLSVCSDELSLVRTLTGDHCAADFARQLGARCDRD